jgi:rhamnose transport system ATP-binding protein
MPARGLSVAGLQTIEIAKAISLDVQVLIMDEPTAALSAHEVSELFNLVCTLRDQGVAIIFIGHRLEEVLEIADRVSVLRNGKLISSKPREEVSTESVIRDMVGRDIDDFFVKSEGDRGDLLMTVRDLSKDGAFGDISFDVRRGEVLGFAGLVGARRTDVGLALFGIEPADSGTITLGGSEYVIRSPERALRLGIAYVTEDRHQHGLIKPMSIAANITLPTLQDYLSSVGLIRRHAERVAAEKFQRRLSIRTPSVDVNVENLSGGNQQKVMLSKWLNAGPQLLILDEPTRGIDVGAKAEVHRIIDDLSAQGMGIIMISSDLPEVLAMSDRIVVMREGRQMATYSRKEATRERVMTAAMGQNDRPKECQV